MASSVFTTFDPTDIVTSQKTIVTTGLFSNNQGSIATAFTGSLQTTASKGYYYDVYDSTSTTAEAQFAVSWGHRLGSGSAGSGQVTSNNDGPSRAVYSQYRSMLLNPGDTTFTFGDKTNSDSIYVINFNRSRLKDRLDPGNWQLSLAELSGSKVSNSAHTGSNVKVSGTGNVITLIDDSSAQQLDAFNTAIFGSNTPGRVFNIVSGSIAGGIYNPTAPHYYGLVYPDMGIIILNDNKLNQSASFNSVSGSNINGDNAWKLFTSISGAFVINSATNAFFARSEETITSATYFVRVKNANYNFTNNPTFVTGSDNKVLPMFFKNPTVYITTIGLYNQNQELLAVAKLSKPIKKTFSTEALIKVKLDF